MFVSQTDGTEWLRLGRRDPSVWQRDKEGLSVWPWAGGGGSKLGRKVSPGSLADKTSFQTGRGSRSSIFQKASTFLGGEREGKARQFFARWRKKVLIDALSFLTFPNAVVTYRKVYPTKNWFLRRHGCSNSHESPADKKNLDGFKVIIWSVAW